MSDRRRSGHIAATQIADDGAPVVTDEVDAIQVEVFDPGGHVLGHAHDAVVAIPGLGRGLVAAHRRRDPAEARARKRGQLEAKGARVVGKAVEAEDGRALPLDQRGERQPASSQRQWGHGARGPGAAEADSAA